jgi:hypothetical protein
MASRTLLAAVLIALHAHGATAQIVDERACDSTPAVSGNYRPGVGLASRKTANRGPSSCSAVILTVPATPT